MGDQLTCVFVDHGLLRKGEAEQVERDYVAATGIRLKVADAQQRFLDALAGVSDPEDKRKAIGREFIRVFEHAAREVVAEAGAHGETVDFLVQGTLYPDVVESGGGTGTANIKSHHNVGGLPDDLEFSLVEPLRSLFKDEVRAVGLELGLPAEIVWRQPFPGPGLGIRIIGEVTRERLDLLREADAIAREELSAAGLDRDIWQCPVVLLADVRSVGVQGDGRTYGHPVVLRPVSSEDAMTADWSRVPYDVLAQDLHADHQRGPRGQPGRPRRDEQAAGHHRVGVAPDLSRSVSEQTSWCATSARTSPTGVTRPTAATRSSRTSRSRTRTARTRRTRSRAPTRPTRSTAPTPWTRWTGSSAPSGWTRARSWTR